MRQNNATAFSLSPFSTSRFPAQVYLINITLLCFLLFTAFPVFGQDFVNGDFEFSSTCDPEDCDDVTIPCIDGWAYWANSNPTEFAWYSYPCQIPDLECKDLGNRGIWLQQDAGGANLLAVAANPAYGQNPNAVYKIDLDFLPYSSDVPPHIKISGVSSISSGTLVPLGYSQDAFEVCKDFHASFFFDHGASIPYPPNITSFRYLVFSVIGFIPAPGQAEPSVTEWGILDNVHMCKVLEVIVQDDCDPVCVSVDFNESCYESPCETQDCSTELLVFSGEDAFIDDANSDSWEDILECSGIPENQEEIDVSFQAINEDFPAGFNIRFTYEITDCPSDYEVTSNMTWDAGSLPNNGKFRTLTVRNGYTLTILGDAVLHFCEEGSLIVEKRAQLELFGRLTSNCSNGWLGVKAYGDQNYNQFVDPNIFSYRQARIFMHPGSVIENAITAIELFGPTTEDTGGQIYADEAMFKNNSRGIVFYPYTNYVIFYGAHSKPRPYESHVYGCQFITDESYQLQQPFWENILLISVDAVPLLGNDFRHTRTLPEAESIWQFGIGIHALGAGFIVDNLNCSSPCESTRSSFQGFGQAIFATRIFENKPYLVNHALFERNYFGIVNSGVSGATLTFNEFNFGSVPNADVRNDQIGMHLRSELFSINVQENTFTYEGESLDNAIGIVSEALGTKDLAIRRNFFNGVTVGNEAFGINAKNSLLRQEGLYYLCNYNQSVQEKDFYVPEESIYESNKIRRNQNTIVLNGPFPINVAAGNTFSSIGNVDDGDLANYGIDQLNYFFNPFGSFEEPIDYFGILSLIEARPNDCVITACDEPCFNPGDIEEAKQTFFNTQDMMDDALNEEDTLLIQYYQNNLDSLFNLIVNYISYDSTIIDVRDTLRTWLPRSKSIAGDLCLSGDYMASAEYSKADDILDSILLRYNLSDEQENDIENIRDLYLLLSSKSIFSLTSPDLSEISEIADGIGNSAAYARGLLGLYEEFFSPTYYVPYEINPRTIHQNNESLSIKNNLIVYPNPTNRFLTVDISRIESSSASFTLFDITGKILLEKILNKGKHEIQIDQYPPGLMHFKIIANHVVIYSGSFIKI